jgi:hypothetical protein
VCAIEYSSAVGMWRGDDVLDRATELT